MGETERRWLYLGTWLAGIPAGMLAGLDLSGALAFGWLVILCVLAPVAIVMTCVLAALTELRPRR